MCLLIITSTNNGSSHRVRLLHCGIGKVSWWSSYNSESQEGGEPSLE